MVDEVERIVREQFKEKGIHVIKLSLLGSMRLPKDIQETMNAQRTRLSVMCVSMALSSRLHFVGDEFAGDPPG
mgnify:CR=1 FL=1